MEANRSVQDICGEIFLFIYGSNILFKNLFNKIPSFLKKAIKKTFKNVFYYGLLCCFWQPLWRKTKEVRARRKKEQEEQRKKAAEAAKRENKINKLKRIKEKQEERIREREERKREKREKGEDYEDEDYDDDNSDIDQDDDFDEEDFDPETQNLSRGQCPFPSTPFSTSNRTQSACVYVIYTYDVLNIFMSLFTTTFTPIYLPYIGNVNLAGSGVIVNIIIQFLQVLIIGMIFSKYQFFPSLTWADDLYLTSIGIVPIKKERLTHCLNSFFSL